MRYAVRQNGSASGRAPGRGIERDLEVERLERELRESRHREEVARAEVRQAHERFQQLRLTSRNFAVSMRESSAERRRSRQRIAAQYAVGRALEEASELEEVAPNVLRILVESLGWTLGTFWSLEGNVLRCHDLRPRAGGEGAFEKACRGLSLRRGEGLPGRAWAAGRPVWVEDVLADGSFLRGSAAEESGLRSAIAIPACDGGRTSGVFELFREEVAPPDEELLRAASAIGGQIGQFAERRRAEKERERLLHREREARAEAEEARGRTVDVLENMGDAFLSFDSAWRFTYANGAAAELFRRIGKDPELIRGEVVWKEVPELVGTKFETETRRAAREGEVVEYEEYVPRIDAWLGARVYPSEGGVSTYLRDVTERKKAREDLMRSEERWRTLIDKGADVITISDRDGVVRFASPSIDTVCGYPAEEFVGRNPFEAGHIHPDDVERCAGTFRELDGRPSHSITIQHRYRHGTGGWRWLEGTFTGLFDDPAIGGLVANFRDVTERKRAEEDARRAAELDAFRVELNDSLRPLADPVAMQREACRLLGGRLDVDRAYFVEVDEAKGYARVEQDFVRGDTPSLAGVFRLSDYGWTVPILQRGEDIVVADAENSEIVPKADRGAMAAVGIAAHVCIPLVKAGTLAGALCVTESAPRRWTKREIELVRETAERIWAAVERARAEEAMRDSEEWLGIAQRAARSGTWEWDLQSGELRWSKEHRDLFGLAPSDEPIELGDWWDVVHPDDLPSIEEAGRRCFETGEEWPEIEYRIFRDGTVRWIAARGRTEKDASGRAVRILGISTDVTERKEAEEERDRLRAREWVARAEVAERERISRELHDRVAHSMAVVHQSLQLHEFLKNTRPSQAAAKMELAQEMAKTALESTRNLSIELRRSEAEEGLVPALQDLLKVSVPPGVRTELRAEGDESCVPPHVRGQLFSILREGVRNAVRHSGASRVCVGINITPGAATCGVEDDGGGFPAAPDGENGDSGAEVGHGAAGVGLRSMRERVGLLGGDFRLSSSPGEGTRVEVTVPLNGGR